MMLNLHNKRFFKLILVLPLMVGVIVFGNETGRAESVDQLKQQMATIEEKIQALEQQQDENTQKIEDAKEESEPPGEKIGSWRLPGSKTRLSINGYVKLDAIFSDKSAGANSVGDQLLVPGLIPVGDADDESDQLVMHARESRFGIRSDTPTEWGNATVYIEGDFFGGDTGDQVTTNSYTFRLRHAYGEVGNLLAGQYWSTFMNADALPETLDFGGPASSLFVRQPQVRWTQPFGWGALLFALENPETTVIAKPGVVATTDPDDDSFPDMIVRANFDTSFGQFDVAGMARQLSFKDGNVNDSQWGGAFSLGGVIPLFSKDSVGFQINYGNALGRYMNTGFADIAVNPVTNGLESFLQWGGFLSYRHFWRENLRSTAAYSYGAADNDLAYVPADTNEKFQSVHVNLIYSPIPQMDTGLEYIWGRRDLENGQAGNLNRIQASIKYLFF